MCQKQHFPRILGGGGVKKLVGTKREKSDQIAADLAICAFMQRNVRASQHPFRAAHDAGAP